MCVAIDMMLADERKQGLSEGHERGFSDGVEFLILKMLKTICLLNKLQLSPIKPSKKFKSLQNVVSSTQVINLSSSTI